MIYTLYLTSLILSATIAVALALYFWRYRNASGGIPAVFLMLAIVVWSLGYVVQLRSAELSGQIFATYIQYLGIVTLPAAWFIFSLQYTALNGRLKRINLFYLAIVPSITLVLVWTNSFHELVWRGTHLETSGPFIMIAKTYAPWFWVHTVYSYLLVLLGTLVLIKRLFRSPRLYHSQIIAILVGVLIPLSWNVLYVFRLFPIYHIDLTPSAFAISGLAWAWGLFRLRFLNIIPVSRDTIIENIRDGIIVLDTQNRFIDINPAAQRIIGHSISDVIGRTYASALSQQPELVERSYIHATESTEVYNEVTIEKGETRYYYELRASPLYDRHSRLIGRLIILHDITAHKLTEMKDQDLERN